MPSHQIALMAVYALWTCLSSVQAKTAHTSLLLRSQHELPFPIHWIVAGVMTTALLLARAYWVRSRAAKGSAPSLPIRAPEIDRKALRSSRPASRRPLSSPSASATEEKPPRAGSRIERRKQFRKKQKKREERDTRKREALETQHGRSTVGGSFGRPVQRRSPSGSVPAAAPSQATAQLQMSRTILRPVAHTKSRGYGPATMPPPPYTQYDPCWSKLGGLQPVLPQHMQQYWQTPIQQYWHPYPTGTYSGAQAYDTGPHSERGPGLVVGGNVCGAEQPSSSSSSSDQRFDTSRQASGNGPCIVRSPQAWGVGDLGHDSYSTDVDDPSLTREPATNTRPVGDLSWVDWSERTQKGMPRAQTLPTSFS